MFVTKTRADGSIHVHLADDAPEWLLAAVRDAHQGTLPNDWIYAECEAAYTSEYDDMAEHADSRIDIYTKDLYQWAADMCLTDTFAQAEAEAEYMASAPGTAVQQLQSIQYCAIRYIAEVIHNARKEHANDV